MRTPRLLAAGTAFGARDLYEMLCAVGHRRVDVEIVDQTRP